MEADALPFPCLRRAAPFLRYPAGHCGTKACLTPRHGILRLLGATASSTCGALFPELVLPVGVARGGR